MSGARRRLGFCIVFVCLDFTGEMGRLQLVIVAKSKLIAKEFS
jgi:hypothetical protein